MRPEREVICRIQDTVTTGVKFNPPYVGVRQNFAKKILVERRARKFCERETQHKKGCCCCMGPREKSSGGRGRIFLEGSVDKNCRGRTGYSRDDFGGPLAADACHEEKVPKACLASLVRFATARAGHVRRARTTEE